MEKLFITNLLFIAFHIPVQAQEHINVLARGQTLALRLQAETIHIADPSVLRAQVVGGQIIFTGKKIGKTHVRRGKRSETFYVLPDEALGAWKTLSIAVRRMRGLTVRIKENTVIVSGRLLRLDDWERLIDFRVPFQLEASMEKEIQEGIEKHIRQKLKNQGLPLLSLQVSPELIAWVQDLKTLPTIEEVLQKLGVRIQERPGSISADPIIEVSILITEVRKKSLLSAGWKMEPVDAQLLPVLSTGSIKARIELLQSKGEAQILASPTLICKSGREAKFLAGGEFPIKMMNIQTNNVVWKPYGVMMTIKPLVDGAERIHLSIATEVSSLDFTQTVDGIPSLLSHRVSTEFDLTRAQTIAISGLIRKEASQEKTGLPILRNIPILGALFGSTAFQNGESELMIFVTPKVKSAGENDVQ